jgi:hypothetical protein
MLSSEPKTRIVRASSRSAARWAACRAVLTWAIVPRRSASEMSFLSLPRTRHTSNRLRNHTKTGRAGAGAGADGGRVVCQSGAQEVENAALGLSSS